MNPPSSLGLHLSAAFPSVSAIILHLSEKLPVLGSLTLLGPPKPTHGLRVLRRFLGSSHLLAQQLWTQLSILSSLSAADALDPRTMEATQF